MPSTGKSSLSATEDNVKVEPGMIFNISVQFEHTQERLRQK